MKKMVASKFTFMEVLGGHYFRLIILKQFNKAIIFSLRCRKKEPFLVVSLFQEKLIK